MFTSKTIGMVFVSFSISVNAHAAVTTTVHGQDNLYYHDWGHVYHSAVGTGVAPSAVAYTFSAGQNLTITATGGVMDSGTRITGPDGDSSWLFRDNPVYALIGVWSSTPM